MLGGIHLDSMSKSWGLFGRPLVSPRVTGAGETRPVACSPRPRMASLILAYNFLSELSQFFCVQGTGRFLEQLVSRLLQFIKRLALVRTVQ
jgi:hypothetical protein